MHDEEEKQQTEDETSQDGKEIEKSHAPNVLSKNLINQLNDEEQENNN